MKAVKTVDRLFEEAKTYDAVISNDAALVTALNNRIDGPMVGRFASTPRMIAEDHEVEVLEKLMNSGMCTKDGIYGIMEDVKLLETVSEITGYDIRFVHGEIENIRTIRRYTRDVEKFIFGTPSKEIYRAFAELPTIEMVMSAFDLSDNDIYAGKKVAVIGIDLFTDLDKHFIPEEFDEIDIFDHEKTFDLGAVHAVGNDRQVAEHAVDLITGDNAEDFAIVMDSKGAIADAVRSALYRKGIAFENKLNARDLVHLRDYMEFISKGLLYKILTVGDVRELFASYGAEAGNRYDEYLLNRYAAVSKKEFKRLSGIMEDLGKYTFAELCENIVDRKHKGTVAMVLRELDLSDVPISERSAAHASYLIGSMDIKHNAEIPENEKYGVLLADCKNSMFIDRSNVIFLNMDSAWSETTAGKDYIDRDDEEAKEIIRFQTLLQQGSSQIYIINTMKHGKVARPCTLFDPLNVKNDGTLQKISSFADVVGADVKKGMWHSDVQTEAEGHASDVDAYDLGKLSQSSINLYLGCPRAYMFGQLVRPPDNESVVLGSMMHEFAEFCLCYPDIASEKIGECVAIVSNDSSGISCPEREEIDRSRTAAAMSGILKFILSLKIDAPLNTDISGRKKKNRFFEHFTLKMGTDIAETERSSHLTPLHGYFDLLSGGTIIDYKTGKPRSASDIAKRMDLKKENDYYDVQAPVYLSMLDDILGGRGQRDFIFFFAMDNEAEAADPDFDVMRNTRTVTLMDMTRDELLLTPLFLEIVAGTKSREFIRTEMGERFGARLLKAGTENAMKWPDDPELLESIVAMCAKDTKKVRDETAYAILKASQLISGCFFPHDNTIYITKDSINSFKEYCRDLHHRIRGQYVAGFPYAPRKGCDRCGFSHMCTGGVANDGTE